MAAPITNPTKKIFIAVLFLAFSISCTADKNVGINHNDEMLTTKTLAASGGCGVEDILPFDRTDGEVIDLTHESLPRGLFLGHHSEFLIEKKAEGGVARVLVREAVGGKNADVVCADNLEKIPPEGIDISITGLVKFDTTENPLGVNLTHRQFFFYQDKTGFGAILSNPKSTAAAVMMDNKKPFNLPGQTVQLIRLADKSYQLKYFRERDGIRARLIVHFETVK